MAMTKGKVLNDWAWNEFGVFSEYFRKVFIILDFSELSKNKSGKSLKNTSLPELVQFAVDVMCGFRDVFKSENGSSEVGQEWCSQKRTEQSEVHR